MVRLDQVGRKKLRACTALTGRLVVLVGMMMIMGVLLALSWAAHAQVGTILEVGAFSMASEGTSLPDGWTPLTFKKIEKQTSYQLVKDGGTTVVKAVSEASASGLTRAITINLADYPIVQWRWKVANVLKQGNAMKPEGDDYPARLYMTFEYDSSKVGLLKKAQYEALKLLYGQYPPLSAITYIWDSALPTGTVLRSPYTERVMMIVVESGMERLNQWVTEERNVYQDYRTAFGNEPPMISGIAVMTDTDNTGEAATAYYGDIVFKKGTL